MVPWVYSALRWTECCKFSGHEILFSSSGKRRCLCEISSFQPWLHIRVTWGVEGPMQGQILLWEVLSWVCFSECGPLHQSIAWEPLEMQNWGVHCRLATRSQYLHCNKIPGPFVRTLKLWKNWSKRISQILIFWFSSLQSGTHNTTYAELQSTNFFIKKLLPGFQETQSPQNSPHTSILQLYFKLSKDFFHRDLLSQSFNLLQDKL